MTVAMLHQVIKTHNLTTVVHPFKRLSKPQLVAAIARHEHSVGAKALPAARPAPKPAAKPAPKPAAPKPAAKPAKKRITPTLVTAKVTGKPAVTGKSQGQQSSDKAMARLTHNVKHKKCVYGEKQGALHKMIEKKGGLQAAYGKKK